MALFEDLKVWQLSQELTVEIYRLLHQNNDYGFKDQIQRASVSIMNNIAEGSESGSDALYLKFLKIAKGSCAEVRSMLYLSKELGYCTNEDVMNLIDKTLFISRSLNRLNPLLPAKERVICFSNRWFSLYLDQSLTRLCPANLQIYKSSKL